MALSIFRENYVNRLQSSIPANLPHYRSKKPWVEVSSSSSLETTIEPLEEIDLRMPDGDDLKDIENAIHLHRALAFLTPVQASDPRLWARLAHVECWDYMRQRWDVDRAQLGQDKGKMQRFILSRYFVAQNQSRALVRHGLARLWWGGFLTYDAERQNPYELTRVLLSLLDITQQILERNYGRIPQVRTGFLEFLLSNKKKLLGGGDNKREHIRQLAKQLNLRGGITLLDSLNKNDVVGVLEDSFSRLDAPPAAGNGAEPG